MNLIEKAEQIATTAHKGQTRKDGKTPYIEHPTAVANILIKNNFPDEVVAAAFVHDVLEDTDFSEKDLLKELGEEVFAIVKTVSEDKSLPWEERKKAYVEQVRGGSEEAKAVSIADKIHNATNILSDYDKSGPDIWKRFTGGYEKTLWSAELVLSMFKDSWNHPLISEYETLVEKLKKLKELKDR